jgi:hypothetical protein
MLNLFDRLNHQFFGGDDIDSNIIASDLENLALGIIQERLDIFLLLIGPAAKTVAGQNQSSEQVLLPNDINVVSRVRRCRDKAIELVQELNTADFFQLGPVL